MSELSGSSKPLGGNGGGTQSAAPGGFWSWLRGLIRHRNGDSPLRDSIEEIIEEIQETEDAGEAATPIGSHEKLLLGNVVKLRNLTAYDVMVPRADIVSVGIGTGIDELIQVMSHASHSRLPVYRGNLDDVLGLVHIKDVLEYTKGARAFDLNRILRKVLAVAPSMLALDLLLEMRMSRVHMSLVVDEFGGVDGLITIEDLVEEIVGEIEDEHDVAEGPKLVKHPDGSLVADARCTIEEFEALVGPVLSSEEREDDIDTLGGLIFSLADRVPTRGELIVHPPSGMSFEVLDADPRRIKRLRLRDLPPIQLADEGGS